MNIDNLHDLYIDQLQDMYSAEQQLVSALPELAQAASTPELKQAFEHHLEVTRGQLESVGGILGELHETPGSKVCRGMQGLIEEGQQVIRNGGSGPALDAALILAAQKVEHYEIATYGGLRSYARTLDFGEAEDILSEFLEQESDADETLTEIADGSMLKDGLNVKARP